jgi:Undecaprenyl-phosphate galactose phosphotransferase WbaP
MLNPIPAVYPFSPAVPAGTREIAAASGRFRYNRRYALNAAAMALTDAASLAASLVLAGAARWLFMGTAHYEFWVLALIPFWLVAATVQGMIPAWAVSPVESLRRLVTLTFMVFGVATALLFLSKTGAEVSRLSLFISFCFALPLIPFARTLTKRALCRSGKWGLPVAIYGAGRTGRAALERLREDVGFGYHPICLFDDNPTLLGTMVDGVPVRGTTLDYSREAAVAIVAIPSMGTRQLAALLEGPLAGYRRVMLLPNLLNLPSFWLECRDLGGMLGLEVASKLLDPARTLMKRWFDLLVVGSTLPLWGPLCALLAGLIWLEDRSNPLFRQARVGLSGGIFSTLKFRTMVPNAEEILREKLESDPEFRAEWNAGCKVKRDPRVTWTGRFLRKTSLDELPQLINVLRGEMSLVGPRPLPDYHYAQLPDEVVRLRERVRPGITGLWQVSGRSESGNLGMIRWDPYYVRNWSLWLDLVILFRTVRVVLYGRGAY